MNDITIATHNGNFHADDVFSIAALKHIFPNFNLIRTRNLEVIGKADLVIDVGGEYNADAGRFDHHQRGGAGERENGIPYSSFGLVWQKYGLEICQGNQDVANAVDAGLVSTIDAIDCGYTEGASKGINQGISLSQTISMFNPTWQEDSHFDSCFDEAVEFATRILTRFIASANGGISAKEIVAKAIENAEDPRVIVLDKYTPWKRTVHALSAQALYMVYPSGSGPWRIQTVPVEPGSFEDRKSLPQAWAGLSDDALKAVTGIDDAMFCHNGLFIAGAETFESTMKMAAIALQEE
ncbi:MULTISPECIES: MYG1 family protein [unclassified Colwellia]|uniref:MYG1 family protein n=1 Tax=unclassified Colwellia TaxID=196834 RepID=UPI0015F3F7E4|nr:MULTISPECIES: MYG1 family protein [unclassified Colwellia]MBA6364041.1 MYG1 family protein [Colwellia sp. BRX8-8]MBA6355182.1 MYG1 family protein [Colwellia sp. BRX8-3]MBA6358814.1 MYG1 family protein [Colwellia sp. BRX8-6]MBA6366328.1 MYG1 family protein [Colwellia sp. BRX8-5]MBA6369934.1 MYG1 family protein [Colwellia sp. BRX8-4]|tara:strand:+ start:905 stop:1789 length:885 start_codon:yes stop_codon:yes gene_type:complete